jgi:hypothetical protein
LLAWLLELLRWWHTSCMVRWQVRQAHMLLLLQCRHSSSRWQCLLLLLPLLHQRPWHSRRCQLLLWRRATLHLPLARCWRRSRALLLQRRALLRQQRTQHTF